MELYLLTGFLGSGKTTLLKNMAGLWPGSRLFVIVNEFGKEGIDGALLESTGLDLVEINNGSIFCSCRVGQFEQALQAAILHHPDVVLVEASGLSDPSSFYEMLELPELSPLQWKATLCLVDAMRFHKVAHTAASAAKQLAASSIAIINKADLASPAQIAEVQQLITDMNPHIPQYITSFGKVEPEWLRDSSYRPSFGKTSLAKDITLQKAVVQIGRCTVAQLEELVGFLSTASYRIKGFVACGEGMMLVNAVGDSCEITPWEGSAPKEENKLVVLAGKGMPLHQQLKKAAGLYPGLIVQLG